MTSLPATIVTVWKRHCRFLYKFRSSVALQPLSLVCRSRDLSDTKRLASLAETSSPAVCDSSILYSTILYTQFAYQTCADRALWPRSYGHRYATALSEDCAGKMLGFRTACTAVAVKRNVYCIDKSSTVLSEWRNQTTLIIMFRQITLTAAVAAVGMAAVQAPTLAQIPILSSLFGSSDEDAAQLDGRIQAQDLLSSHFGMYGWPGQSFDYVIVGGGTSGLAMARRLSQDGSASVAVIEAGGFYEIDAGNATEVPMYLFNYFFDNGYMSKCTR